MRWMNPLAWLGLCMLALPVLIHLFSRRQTRVIPFPSLRFVAPSPLLPTRRMRLSDMTLLLIRLATLAFAVAALAGPLLSRSTTAMGTGGSGAAVVRAVIVDTSRGHGDSASRNAVDSIVAQLESESQGAMTLPTAAPFLAIPGAIAWLQQQSGVRELVVLSNFRVGALDSLDLTRVPRSVTVRLVRTALPMAAVNAARKNTVVWWTDAPNAPNNSEPTANAFTMHDAVRRAVIARGGSALTADSSRVTATPNAHEIVVSAIDTDSLGAWLPQAMALRAPWMGDALEALHRDTTLAVAMSSVFGMADTVFSSPLVVIARSQEFAPLVAAAAIPGSASRVGAGDRLVLLVRTADDAVATAALLLAASNAVATVPTVEWSASMTTTDAVATDVQLRRWERAPAAAAETRQRTAGGDFATGPSDGRWMWVVVLALVGLETVVRRKSATPLDVAGGATDV